MEKLIKTNEGDYYNLQNIVKFSIRTKPWGEQFIYTPYFVTVTSVEHDILQDYMDRDIAVADLNRFLRINFDIQKGYM